MITADQIVAHLVGDYILQSDWMANEKTKRSVAALAHVLCYSLPFLLFRPSLAAWAFIVVTHFVIDRLAARAIRGVGEELPDATVLGASHRRLRVALQRTELS